MNAIIKVRLGKGRTHCPIHRFDYAAAGNRPFVLQGDTVIEVPNSPGIRRRIRAGDLVEVDPRVARADVDSARVVTATDGLGNRFDLDKER